MFKLKLIAIFFVSCLIVINANALYLLGYINIKNEHDQEVTLKLTETKIVEGNLLADTCERILTITPGKTESICFGYGGPGILTGDKKQDRSFQTKITSINVQTKISGKEINKTFIISSKLTTYIIKKHVEFDDELTFYGYDSNDHKEIF